MPVIEGSITIEHGKTHLQLLPDRAIFFAACNTLILADVHVGKGTAFRSAGLPIPAGSSLKDLHRIDRLLAQTDAKRLVVLGDFLHARTSRQPQTLETIANWRASHAQLPILLVRGNHDRSAGRVPADWRVQEVEEPFDEGCGVLFSHEPRDGGGLPVLCGHMHPVVSVRDFDRSTVRVPCFCFDERGCGILPAFGSLTGGHNVGMREGQRLFLAMGAKVIPAERVRGRMSIAG